MLEIKTTTNRRGLFFISSLSIIIVYLRTHIGTIVKMRNVSSAQLQCCNLPAGNNEVDFVCAVNRAQPAGAGVDGDLS